MSFCLYEPFGVFGNFFLTLSILDTTNFAPNVLITCNISGSFLSYKWKVSICTRSSTLTRRHTAPTLAAKTTLMKLTVVFVTELQKVFRLIRVNLVETYLTKHTKPSLNCVATHTISHTPETEDSKHWTGFLPAGGWDTATQRPPEGSTAPRNSIIPYIRSHRDL